MAQRRSSLEHFLAVVILKARGYLDKSYPKELGKKLTLVASNPHIRIHVNKDRKIARKQTVRMVRILNLRYHAMQCLPQEIAQRRLSDEDEVRDD